MNDSLFFLGGILTGFIICAIPYAWKSISCTKYVWKVVHAVKPYKLLSEISFNNGDKLNCALLEQQDCFGNDFLPAYVERVGFSRVFVQWENGWTATCAPNKIAVRQ